MKLLFILGLVLSVTLAVELQAGVPALLAQIKQIKVEEERGEEFKNLLDLELSQGSKVDEVVTMIKELLDQLKSDQQIEDIEHAHTMTRLQLDIEELQIILARLQSERTATNTFIQDTTVELKSLTETVENQKAQLDLLNGKEEDIRTTRSEEQVAYQHRTQNNNKVLQALNEVLQRLGQAVFREQDRQGAVLLETERDEIVESIKRELGHNNPIAIMVSLTAKFDIATVTRIIEKLEVIRDAVAASQVDEDNRETQAQQSFQSTIQELNDVREKLSQDYQQTSQLLRKRTNEKVTAEKKLTILNSDIETTQQILVNTRNQREQYDANYQSRRGKRSGEIKTIQAAYDLVSAHAGRIRQQE